MPKPKMKLAPVHFGDTLREDFLSPFSLSANRLALELHVRVTRINDILHARRSITAGTALRLARYFGTTPEFWVNLQAHFDLEMAQEASGAVIAAQVRPRAA